MAARVHKSWRRVLTRGIKRGNVPLYWIARRATKVEYLPGGQFIVHGLEDFADHLRTLSDTEAGQDDA